MAKAETLRFSKFLILVGDGGTPEQFAAPCGLNSRSYNRTAATNDTNVPDCDDPDAPSWLERDIVSESVRKKDVSKLDAYGTGKLSVLVMAGGPLTMRWTKSGSSYDYALAAEFGTVNEQARPFFYSSARFYQQHDIDWARETVEQAIAENDRTRADLNQLNWQDAGVCTKRIFAGAAWALDDIWQ